MSDDTQLVPTRKLSAAGKKGDTPDTEEKLKSYGHWKKSVQCFTEAVVSKKTRGLFYYRAACSLPAFVPFILAKRYFDRF